MILLTAGPRPTAGGHPRKPLVSPREEPRHERLVRPAIALDYYAPYVSGLTNVARDVAVGLGSAVTG